MADVRDGGIYKIVNVKGHTVIDLNSNDDRSIAGYEWHGGDNQKWVASTQNGLWYFKSVASGRYLAIDGEASDNGAVVGSTNPFGWNIWPDEDNVNVLRICVPNTRHNVDLSDHGNPNPGTPITIWGRWKGTNQTWTFEPGWC
ncbi:carbohydrate-binding module family 13 protein [Laccaria amethystina LaAM-08-1]|uniref:Unplaced genomic scaffold K443scaffold_157, whole genome shotgun sequence n=1 Tax=Laccaria amethystina LaAM-08-1 TaxID=1095629 RepID=A0A0C9WLQ5_9AGAR|nr:carbohydrate-binding module family 13 protein [Laccaria amethystina LaAM-08-1]